MDSQWLRAVRAAANLRKVAAGEILRHQTDDSAVTLDYIESGEIEAIFYSRSGQEIWLSQFTAGDFIFHDSLLPEISGPHELCVMRDVTLLSIPKHALADLLANSPGVSAALAANLAQQIDALFAHLSEVSSVSAKGRISAELIRLSSPIGLSPGEHVIRPNPVFIDMARRLNTTRETVSRTVGDLVRDKIVSRAKGALIIHNLEQLESRFD